VQQAADRVEVTEEDRRRRIGGAIVAGYRRLPQEAYDPAGCDEALRRMIADEPW